MEGRKYISSFHQRKGSDNEAHLLLVQLKAWMTSLSTRFGSSRHFPPSLASCSDFTQKKWMRYTTRAVAVGHLSFMINVGLPSLGSSLLQGRWDQIPFSTKKYTSLDAAVGDVTGD